METILPRMADCEFYASIYAESLHTTLDSEQTTVAFREKMESALPEFYSAVLVFCIKAKAYFLPVGSGKMIVLQGKRRVRTYRLIFACML
jgi:hypothetical protein